MLEEAKTQGVMISLMTMGVCYIWIYIAIDNERRLKQYLLILKIPSNFSIYLRLLCL